MTNRIGPVDHTSIGKSGNKADETGSVGKLPRDSAAPGAVAANKPTAADTVKLTSSAKLLERLEKTLATLPEVDSSRVAEVKTAIENGEYTIDADAIAESILSFERSPGE